MNLSDYEAPATPIDPTPRRSQDIAAAKLARAAQPQEADEPIAPHITPQRQQLIMGIVGVLTVVGVLALAIGQHGIQAPTPLPITPAATVPAQVFATDPVASSVAAQDGPGVTKALGRTISAYAAPGGPLLGPIEITRQITPIAHYGADWVQADVAGSGRVWLRWRDMPSLAITGPDLAPVASAPQTGRGLTLAVDTPEPAPEATPEPAPAIPTADAVLKVRTESDCNAEHGRCDPPCTAEHGRCSAGDK